MDKKKTVKTDYKIFEAKQGKFGVSQVEVSNINQLTPDVLNELKEVLKQLKTEDHLFLACCLVTDVQASSSVLLTDGPDGFRDVINCPIWNNLDWCFFLKDVVSRKK